MHRNDAICEADFVGSYSQPSYFCEECGASLVYQPYDKLCDTCEERRQEQLDEQKEAA